jgi:hypothetical protein
MSTTNQIEVEEWVTPEIALFHLHSEKQGSHAWTYLNKFLAEVETNKRWPAERIRVCRKLANYAKRVAKNQSEKRIETKCKEAVDIWQKLLNAPFETLTLEDLGYMWWNYYLTGDEGTSERLYDLANTFVPSNMEQLVLNEVAIVLWELNLNKGYIEG